MKNIIEKMIDHPIASFIVVGVIVDGVSILVYNVAEVLRSK